MELAHSLLTLLGVEHGFGTRLSKGDSGQELGKSREAVTLRQVHGTNVLPEIEILSAGVPSSGDGLFSGPGGRPVGVWTADCLPVFLSSRSGRHVAALHAGWRGATSGIAREGVRHLLREGGGPAREMRAVLGPSIGPCCYEVGSEVWEAVGTGTPGYRPSSTTKLDIRGLVAFQLEEMGLLPENIGSLPLCTRCHPDLFFSHRGMGGERKGRSMINYILPRP